MNPSIRRARPADAFLVADLDRLVQATPWPQSRIRAACADGDRDTPACFIAPGSAGCIDGFVVYSLAPGEGTIENMGVAESRRGRGIGRALLRAACEDMHHRGAQRCLLEVRMSNVAARALYESEDFVLDGRRVDYYQTPDGREDALLMSRRLQENTG
ncbi:MAG: ribosomal protein S18-alanine N-acetyltransferase [Halioglobus sp.]|nr:ribosomal protein S18-alanine N-acetyltransferase [Halioglobus sp.]